jgi:hypothetical protein
LGHFHELWQLDTNSSRMDLQTNRDLIAAALARIPVGDCAALQTQYVIGTIYSVIPYPFISSGTL